ncbi:MAG: NFACT family protein [Clostridiales Family XIII bacterium]|jgi:predicted ribosome quality control (RQC) complex YloA/Tae2 family protein|nr:NFACT family protein [Clostridiales Family XIII bacterium]
MDGIKIAKIVNELDKILLWTRLEKIYQLSKTEIELVFNSKKGKQILYISIAANALRFFLIKNKFSYAKNPPAFCMLLRKHLQGSRLKNIVQLGTDRVVNFTFKTKNEFGTIKEKILVLEMLGRHGNIILLDSENKIIDALRRIPLDMSDKRAIFPKLKYEPILENGKISLFSDSAEKNFSELNINSDEDFIREKLMSIQGLSNKRKDEIIAEIKKGESGIDIIYKIKSFIKNSDGYSSKLEYYYRYEKQETELDKEKNNIIKKLNKENKKILKKLEGYDLLLKKSEEANIYKEKGDLIFANLNNIKKGKKEITLNSFNGDDKIKIDLDLKKSIVQNANDFYKKYHKLKDSVSHINEQKNILKEKIIQIESYITFIKNTENFEDFNNIIFEIYKFKILINYNKKKINNPKV